MRLETFQRPSATGAHPESAAAYGACDNRQGNVDVHPDFIYCGVPADPRADVSFKRFSRSVKFALRAGAHPHQHEEKEKDDHRELPSSPPALPSSPPRLWWDVSNDLAGVRGLIKESAVLLVLLVAGVSLAVTSVQLHWGPTPVFTLCFFGLIPLAVLLGDLTESLSGWCGPTLGGLVNATLGNATEAIVLVQAVRHGLVGVEQAALLGGVLSNMLLVVGLSFIFGGIATGGTQKFDRRVTMADIGVLLVSVIAVVLPTIAASAPGGNERDTLADSRSTAIVLLIMYVAFLFYTLSPTKKPKSGDAESTQLLKPAAAEEEEEEPPSISMWTLLLLLILVTFAMAILSNALVLNVFPVSAALDITPDLVSCIFLPIIGNIAELTTAVIAARRGAVDLSLAVAFGSSTQISLFLLPLAAMLGWAIDVPFSFDFSPTFTTAFFASVVVVAVVVSDGEATWLKGVMLCGTYTGACPLLMHIAGLACLHVLCRPQSLP